MALAVQVGLVRLALSGALVLLQACSHAPTFTSASPEWIDARTGNLIAVKADDDGGKHNQAIAVEHSWAALIVWNDSERLFYLFDNVRRAYVATGSWPEFLAAMRAVPEGTRIQKFYKCSAAWDYAMPDAQSNQLDRVMKSRRLSWRPFGEDVFTFMVCVHRGIEYPPQ